MTQRGDVVRTWFDDGRGGGWVYGLVVAAGRRTFTVLWPSGRRNTRPQGDRLVEPVPDSPLSREVAEADLRLIRLGLKARR